MPRLWAKEHAYRSSAQLRAFHCDMKRWLAQTLTPSLCDGQTRACSGWAARFKSLCPVLATIKWGIVGSGSTARAFANSILSLPGSVLQAIGSRTSKHAMAFPFDLQTRHASYAALYSDPQVDAVYIATPHRFHMRNTLDAIQAGKAVLCEKAFATSYAEALIMVRAARQRKVFLMEAISTTLSPVWPQVRTWMIEGEIGEIKSVVAEFGAPISSSDWRMKQGGGGALLDTGIYALDLIGSLLGYHPNRIHVDAVLNNDGVDLNNTITMSYNGVVAVARSSAISLILPIAEIVGSEGTISLSNFPNFGGQQQARIHRAKGLPDEETFAIDHEVAIDPEAFEASEALRQGWIESPRMPLNSSLAKMELLDAIRMKM